MSYQSVVTLARVRFLGVLLSSLLLARIGYNQISQDKVNAAINQAKQGDFSQGATGVIAQARAMQAIPILKEQFTLKRDPDTKAAIASALVKMEDKDPIYWQFLVDEATPGVLSDAPFPSDFDERGKLEPGQYSSAFLIWVKNHHVSADSVARAELEEFPSRLILLAATGDPRGITLLRRGLRSPNYLIESIAAKGLAKLQDADSVPLILNACRRAPTDAVFAISMSLLFFHDSKARQAAEPYLPKEVVSALHEGKPFPLADPFP
jgi:HEAT repeat protein